MGELLEGFNLIQLTPEDQAANIRSLIKTCWDNVDIYSMYAQQLNDYGNLGGKDVLDCLINDLYIAIGSLEELLGKVDYKSAAIDTPAQVQALAQVAPQVVTQMAAAPAVIPMVEQFILDESDAFDDDIKKTADKPEIEAQPKEKDVVEFNRKPIEKELEATEKHRKENVKTSMNPDREELEEELDNMANVDDANYFMSEVDGLQNEAGQLAQEADQAGLNAVKKAAEAAFDALDDPTLNEDEDLGEDETLNPHFYESLLKLED